MARNRERGRSPKRNGRSIKKLGATSRSVQEDQAITVLVRASVVADAGSAEALLMTSYKFNALHFGEDPYGNENTAPVGVRTGASTRHYLPRPLEGDLSTVEL